MSLEPVRVLGEGAQESKGENARLEIFVGAIAISDLVKTTLGPRGMDKILQSMTNPRDLKVTNDGATILRSLYIENPAAKVLIDISRVQDDDVGDGTTSVCVFAGELLREAEKLIDKKLHPQLIIDGFRTAQKVAVEALTAASQNHESDSEAFRRDLFKIASTTLSSKILYQSKDHFAQLAVDAILRLGKDAMSHLDHIAYIKKLGGSLSDSFLEEGFMLDKKIGVGQPKSIQNAKILVANTPMDTDKIKIFGARVRTSSSDGVAQIETAERQKMTQKVENIAAHGCNVFVNRQLIYSLPEQLLADKGIMSIEHADFEGVERLAAVLGAEIVSTFDEPNPEVLGEAANVSEIMVGEDRLIRFSGCGKGAACTVVLRGASEQLLDEAERALHDAFCVLTQAVKDPRIVYGGGSAEMLMARAVEDEARKTAGKKALALSAFATALSRLPTIIADNAGLDGTDLVHQLKALHSQGKSTFGINVDDGVPFDMAELGVTESLRVKRHVVNSATEAAELILRVDDIVKTAPRQREE
ncbi:hypothetical protein P9112_007269 [Eukaryota sp. TZLM1-RC]